jgi:hypothetical protein
MQIRFDENKGSQVSIGSVTVRMRSSDESESERERKGFWVVRFVRSLKMTVLFLSVKVGCVLDSYPPHHQ